MLLVTTSQMRTLVLRGLWDLLKVVASRGNRKWTIYPYFQQITMNARASDVLVSTSDLPSITVNSFLEHRSLFLEHCMGYLYWRATGRHCTLLPKKLLFFLSYKYFQLFFPFNYLLHKAFAPSIPTSLCCSLQPFLLRAALWSSACGWFSSS